jgi:hypothetical protein
MADIDDKNPSCMRVNKSPSIVDASFRSLSAVAAQAAGSPFHAAELCLEQFSTAELAFEAGWMPRISACPHSIVLDLGTTTAAFLALSRNTAAAFQHSGLKHGCIRLERLVANRT